jgi:hypothetical protein
MRLQHYLQRLSATATKPQNAWLSPLTLLSLGMLAGSQSLIWLAAPLQVVRRAIEYLEGQWGSAGEWSAIVQVEFVKRRMFLRDATRVLRQNEFGPAVS